MRPSLSDRDHEVLVIGSGFGGAVTAYRLAEAGYRVRILERGKRWEGDDPFATYAHPDGRAAWRSTMTVDPFHPPTSIDYAPGILEQRQGGSMSVLSGVGVGGGSLVFTGVLVQPAFDEFVRMFCWLDYELMQNYYQRVRSVIEPAPVPPDLFDVHPHFEHARLFTDWVRQAGLLPVSFDLALDWDIVRQEIQGAVPASLTAGENWYGLNSGAKKSLDKNYLSRAEATGRVTICPLHLVKTIVAQQDDGGREYYLVQGDELNEHDASKRQTFCYRSSLVFVAAGSWQTTELFLRAQATGSLPRLRWNAAIGQGFGNNGDVIGLHRGHHGSISVPQIAAGMGTFHQHSNGRTCVLGDAMNGAPPGNLLTLSMARPDTGFPTLGSFTYDQAHDQSRLQWPEDTPEIQSLVETACQTYTYLDSHAAHHTFHPSTPVIQSSVTAHPLGGMVLGKACDRETGRVYGCDGIYVVDGSLLPGWAGGGPPALTIAAMAEWLLDQFLLSTGSGGLFV